MTYTFVKENGSFLEGRAFESVVDAVQRDATQCDVAGYTVHLLEAVVDSVDHCTVKVKVEGIDE